MAKTEKKPSRQAAWTAARKAEGWIGKHYLWPPAMVALLAAGAARYGSEAAFLQTAAERLLASPGNAPGDRLAAMLDAAGLELREKGGAAVSGDARPGDDG